MNTIDITITNLQDPSIITTRDLEEALQYVEIWVDHRNIWIKPKRRGFFRSIPSSVHRIFRHGLTSGSGEILINIGETTRSWWGKDQYVKPRYFNNDVKLTEDAAAIWYNRIVPSIDQQVQKLREPLVDGFEDNPVSFSVNVVRK